MTQFVRERFPERQADILALYLRSPEFRGLCHDFGVCVEEINRLVELNDSPSKSVHQRLEQYRELERELKAEIVEQLNSALTTPRQMFQLRKENHERPDSEPT